MSWHHPDLYFVLCLLAGLAALLAIIYECTQKFRRRKPPEYLKKAEPLDGLRRDRKPPVVLKKAKPLDGLQRDRPARPTEGRASERPSDFSRLSESVKDLPLQEQASRVREYFGILGGARPAEGPGRRAKNAGH